MDFVMSIRHDSELFYDTALVADPSLGVPCCPDWTVADLVWHLGEVHWFWATDIEERATGPEQVEASKPSRPQSYTDLVAWGRSQADHLVRLLESTADDVRAWTWASDDSDHTVGFIRRHQVQETAVHRWDMQSAAAQTTPDPIDPEIASDCIDEFLTVQLPFVVNENKPLSGSVHLHCTDVAGEWFIEPKGKVDRAHATGDVGIRGTASDILLALYDRISVDALNVVGDASLAHHLVEQVDTT